MIKLGAFLPREYLELQNVLDYCFLEPMDDDYYKSFYRGRSPEMGDLILDNGLIELGSSIDGNLLKEYATFVRADWVIPPDRLGNWEFNITAAREFAFKWPRPKTLVALAGPTPASFYEQARIVRDEGFGGVCLPYRLNRVPILADRVHMLGMKMPEQFSSFLARGAEVSYDTTEPISAAMHGVWYHQRRGIWTVKRPEDYFTREYDGGTMHIALENINYLKTWIAEHSQEVPK